MVAEKSSARQELERWFSGAERVVVVGIGNPIRMDDNVGVKVLQKLQGKVSEKVYLIECETVPENFMLQIIDFLPTHVLLVDAALLDSKPGSYGLVQPDRLKASPAFSTHMLPLRIFCEHIRETTRAKIALLLVEPEKTDFGEGLTPTAQASVKEIVKTLSRLLPQ